MIKEILHNQTLIERFLKFCIVGGSGVVVDFGITYLAKEFLKLNKYVANSLGFICAATSNYILNRTWTFGSNDPDVVMQYFRFFGFSLIGLAINNLVIYLLHGRVKWNFYIVKLIATCVVTFWNFSMNYIFTFQ
jgi:putative flippase GtrA